MSRPKHDPRIAADFLNALEAVRAGSDPVTLAAVAKHAGRSLRLISGADPAYPDVKAKILQTAAHRAPALMPLPADARKAVAAANATAAAARREASLARERTAAALGRMRAAVSAMAAMLVAQSEAAKPDLQLADRESRKRARETNKLIESAAKH